MQFEIKYTLKNLVVFHNGLKYDYYFVIKELAEDFEGESNCLGENTEKYNPFSVLLKKKLKELVKMEKRL